MTKNNLQNNDFTIPDNVRITFGIIVLNGLPFIEYNLRALYPFAHQIVIVEGAAPSAKRYASESGHSLDGTLDVLNRFKKEEDPENKILIITAEDDGMPNGFWMEKDEMSQAYAKRATGNYIWQIDCDEFYLEYDMLSIMQMLSKNPDIKAVSFSMKTFWGSPKFIVEGFFLNKFVVHRIFAWGNGYQYISHRPVTIVDETGTNLRKLKWISNKAMKKKGIYMYHFELIFPKQVVEKCGYYAGAEWTTALQKANEWAINCYLKIGKPFRVHMMYMYISWLEKYDSKLPGQINCMMKDVAEKKFVGMDFRNMTDADKLIKTTSYRVSKSILKIWLPIDEILSDIMTWFKNTLLGRSLIKMKNKFKGQLIPIYHKEVSIKLLEGWKSSSIPLKQKELTKVELSNMYGGSVVKPFQVLADSIRMIGSEDHRIIEIGCSTGYYYEVLSYLLNKKINYTGVDYSESMIKEAISTYKHLPFIVADATELPLSNNSFDIVISGCCLLHIPKYAEAISEAARISNRWVIFHRTPIINGETKHFKKKAYGVPCVEIHFNENEFIGLCITNKLLLRNTFDISFNGESSQKTYIFEKQ